ncbi:hypothetical protein [Wolbachia endosymbiont of Atemnus politus]|uniref:hypothetical protein n=1 Tax=Wolbachia endosymbiont of Atemnus politus TaxID=2682840 RepID=UPI00210700CB|nr:hypothetical protein [Wolbachia endosymbiont of Atemnus politus]
MNNTVEKNNPKIFPKNEGKIKSKGMVAPPVPPKSSQAKFAGIKAIFERNAPHSQANKTVSSNLGRTFGPTMQKLMENNIHSTPNKQRRDSGDSGISDVSSSTSDDENRIIKEKITKNVKQDNHQKSSNSHQTQATVDDMLFEGKCSDRFKVRPFLCSDIDGYTAPGKRDLNLERCMVTRDGRRIEPKVERKHGFNRIQVLSI